MRTTSGIALLSILAIVFSHVSSQLMHRRAIHLLDEGDSDAGRVLGPSTTATTVLNVVALSAFVVGVGFLVA